MANLPCVDCKCHPDTVVGRAFIATLENVLGSLWTPHVRLAWINTFRTMARVMKEGAAEGPDPGIERTKLVQKTWGMISADLEQVGVRLFTGKLDAAGNMLRHGQGS